MSKPYIHQLLDRSNGQSLHTGTSSYQDGSTAFHLAEEMSREPQLVRPVSQDPYAYYKAFSDESGRSSHITHELGQDDDSYTFHTGIIGVQDYTSMGHPPQARARAAPYHPAVRVANRSNGVPLATIIEQGSYSTLNSHPSLLGIGRFASRRVAENASPGRASHKGSRSLDETTLHWIREDVPQEQDARVGIDSHARSQGYGRSPSTSDTPMKASAPIYPHSPRSEVSEGDCEVEGKRLKGFFRGVLQNVRATSRTRSRSSSASFVDAREERAETSDGPLEYQPHSDHHSSIDFAQTSSSSASSTPAVGHKARNRKIVTTHPQPSPDVYPMLFESSLPLLKQGTGLGAVPHTLPRSAVTRSREPSPSVRLVPPEPRDMAQVDATVGVTSTLHGSDNKPARHMFDGDPVPHKNASSVLDQNRARDASRNASFCSSMSTSYSGTVLGIDLDLQQEYTPPVRRSSSPMPV
jgi:hypothetical protein